MGANAFNGFNEVQCTVNEFNEPRLRGVSAAENMIYYNLADQGFKSSARASVGVYNVSVQMALNLADEIRRFADRIGYKNLPPIVTAGIGFDHLLDAPCEEERNGILVYVSSFPHKASVALLEKLKRWQYESRISGIGTTGRK